MIRKTIVIAALLPAIIFICWYVFGRSNVSNNGVGADQVRSDLSAVRQQQSAAIDGLDRIETGLGDSAAKAGAISAGISGTAKSIATLRVESTQARTQLEAAQSSLHKANQSLSEYEKEVKAEYRSLKLQRDIRFLAAVYFAIKK